MLKSDLRPLATPKQKLSFDPTLVKVATVALSAGAAFAGKAVSRWVWQHYVAPRRKAKHPQRVVLDIKGDVHVIQIETIEQHIIRTRKQTRIILKRK